MPRSFFLAAALLCCVMATTVPAQTDALPVPTDLKVFADPTPAVALPTPSATPVKTAEVDDQRCVDLEIRLIERHSAVKLPEEPNQPGNEPKASKIAPIRVLTKEEIKDFVQLCQNDRRSNILAAPRLRLPIGQKGQLRSGGEVVYSTIPETTNQETGEVTPERRLTEFFGIAVDTTVTISKPGLLRVNLMVEHSALTSQKVEPGQRPAKKAARVQTIIDCPNGQTCMLHGLKSQQQTAVTTKLPVLGDLPFLGDAFSRKRVDSEEVELVVLITAVLMDELSQ